MDLVFAVGTLYPDEFQIIVEDMNGYNIVEDDYQDDGNLVFGLLHQDYGYQIFGLQGRIQALPDVTWLKYWHPLFPGKLGVPIVYNASRIPIDLFQKYYHQLCRLLNFTQPSRNIPTPFFVLEALSFLETEKAEDRFVSESVAESRWEERLQTLWISASGASYLYSDRQMQSAYTAVLPDSLFPREILKLHPSYRIYAWSKLPAKASTVIKEWLREKCGEEAETIRGDLFTFGEYTKLGYRKVIDMYNPVDEFSEAENNLHLGIYQARIYGYNPATEEEGWNTDGPTLYFTYNPDVDRRVEIRVSGAGTYGFLDGITLSEDDLLRFAARAVAQVRIGSHEVTLLPPHWMSLSFYARYLYDNPVLAGQLELLSIRTDS